MNTSTKKIFFAVVTVFILAFAFFPSVSRAANCCCAIDYSRCFDNPDPSCPADMQAVGTAQSCSDLEKSPDAQNQTKQSWVTKVLSGQELIPPGCREGRQATKTDCGINEIILTLVNITRIMFGVVGSVALIMFVYGGVMFMISAGHSDRVNKGKTILTNTTIGIIILFTSWIIINFIVLAITGGREDIGKNAKIFESEDITIPPKSPK